MIFRHDQAKLYWCAFATFETAIPPLRINDSPHEQYHCIGSQCPGWRWVDNKLVMGYCGYGGPVPFPGKRR